MLNEILEANEYLYDVRNSDSGSQRIKHTILLKKNKYKKIEFLGLEHILIVIARYFIYDDVSYTEGLKRADAAIRLWCGHASLDNTENELAEQYDYFRDNWWWIDHWFSEYLRDIVSSDNEETMEKIEEAIKALEDKKKGFSISSLNKGTKDNDFKTIYYDKILANAAVSKGPLKRYYLACRDPEWDTQLRGKDGKLLSERLKDRVLKTIAAYMLERNAKPRKDEAPRYERLNLKDIAFWTVMDTRLDRGHYCDFTISGRPVFVFKTGMSGNLTKAKIDPEWFSACGWELIDATENDSELDAFLDSNPEGIFFSDWGGCKPLELNLRYGN